jgi:hypothetical protein
VRIDCCYVAGPGTGTGSTISLDQVKGNHTIMVVERKMSISVCMKEVVLKTCLNLDGEQEKGDSYENIVQISLMYCKATSDIDFFCCDHLKDTGKETDKTETEKCNAAVTSSRQSGN